MPNITNSGYLAAAAAATFSGTQTLNSLLNNEWTNWSDEIDNGTNKYMEMDLELVLGSAAFTGVTSAVEIYVIPTVDGTNYPSWQGDTTTDEQENAPFAVGSIPTTGTTAAQRGVLEAVRVPQGKFRFGVRNRSGVTLASSGNTLSWRPRSIAF